MRKVITGAGTESRAGRAPLSTAPATLINVAILDGDRNFLQYIENFLKDEGKYAVHAYARPLTFLAACRHRPPDILLLDVKMEQYKGEKILDWVLSFRPRTCIVIVTGHPPPDPMRTTFRLKVFDYLVRPFSLEQLRQTLTHAVDVYGFGGSDPERFRQSLGHRVRVLRSERCWSLRNLSDITELSISQISSIERGSHLPSVESLLLIARAFRMRPSELLSSIDF
jgi:FixJ family two-component response regulator